jgi:hypothetical protein
VLTFATLLSLSSQLATGPSALKTEEASRIAVEFKCA